MPITERQREQMTKHIGASNAAACLGLSRWATPADMYWYFTEGVTTQAGVAAEIGNTLEPSILDDFERTTGLKITRNQRRVKDIFRATHDALVVDQPIAVQAKSAGIMRPESTDEWGEPGTDEVPQEVVVQCLVECYVSDLELVWIPALIARRGFVTFKVQRNDDAIQAIVQSCESFWRDNVLAKVPPADSVPNIEVVKRIRRIDGKRIDLDDEVVRLVSAWETMREERIKAERGEEFLQARILAALGDAELGTLGDGREFSYLEQNGAPRADFDLMQADGVYDKYVTQGRHRVARIRKSK